MSYTKPDKGFTLIEVLIAMTLLSVMVLLLFTSLKICAQSWEKGETKITEINEIAVVYNFFQQHLASAKPVTNDFAEENVASFGFRGAGQSMTFVTSLPAAVGRTGLQQFSLQLQKKNDEQEIIIILTPFFPIAEGEEWRKDEAVLIKHVQSLEISYFGSDDGVSDGSWLPEWQEKEVQPQLVKIKIGLDNGIYWPDMIIKMNVSGVFSNEDFDSEVTDDSEDSSNDTTNPSASDGDSQ